MAWSNSIPANDELLINFPALCRANWAALEALTDAALQITNAKVAAGAAIADSKLATISTAGKVNAAALTGLASTPAGAGVLPVANSPCKLKADAADATPQYLDSLIDTNMFEITAADVLALKDGGVPPEALEGGAAAPGNNKVYGTSGAGALGFLERGKVRADAGDSSPDYLSGKVDGTTIEVTAGDQLGVKDASISTAKLKTSSGSVSLSSGSIRASQLTLPGGTYGFYPQIKMGTTNNEEWGAFICTHTADGLQVFAGWTSYVTNISLSSGGDAGETIYAQQRYITASGRDHWVFLLVAAKDYTRTVLGETETYKRGHIKSMWEAPDHPSYGTAMDENELPHPFSAKLNHVRQYPNDEELDIVILLNNDFLSLIKSKITSKKGILDIIKEEYSVDMGSSPRYEEREIIDIDEHGDKPGSIIGRMKTPQWTKVAIKSDEFLLKRRIVKADFLQRHRILYKSLKRK